MADWVQDTNELISVPLLILFSDVQKSEGSDRQSVSQDKPQQAAEVNAIVESIFLVTFDPGCYPIESSVDNGQFQWLCAHVGLHPSV